MSAHLAITGMGVNTDGIASSAALAARLGVACDEVAPLDPAALRPHDALTRLALPAVHEAMQRADLLHRLSPERVALLSITMFGPIDSTVAYLDSMLEAGGRYASPRHFARSVYSSLASLVAIELGLHGPCETLAFAQGVVRPALERAAALLDARRADAVLVVWADQASELGAALAHRAVERLHQKAYERYGGGMGGGAVALVMERASTPDGAGLQPVEAPLHNAPGRPYATDAALRLAADVLCQQARQKPVILRL